MEVVRLAAIATVLVFACLGGKYGKYGGKYGDRKSKMKIENTENTVTVNPYPKFAVPHSRDKV